SKTPKTPNATWTKAVTTTTDGFFWGMGASRRVSTSGPAPEVSRDTAARTASAVAARRRRLVAVTPRAGRPTVVGGVSWTRRGLLRLVGEGPRRLGAQHDSQDDQGVDPGEGGDHAHRHFHDRDHGFRDLSVLALARALGLDHLVHQIGKQGHEH